MATIVGKPKIELLVTIALSEQEARALDALVGYGDDAFIKAFYEKLGEGYMRDHEAGLRSLFTSVRSQLPGWLGRIDMVRKSFNVQASS